MSIHCDKVEMNVPAKNPVSAKLEMMACIDRQKYTTLPATTPSLVETNMGTQGAQYRFLRGAAVLHILFRIVSCVFVSSDVLIGPARARQQPNQRWP